MANRTMVEQSKLLAALLRDLGLSCNDLLITAATFVPAVGMGVDMGMDEMMNTMLNRLVDDFNRLKTELKVVQKENEQERLERIKDVTTN